MALTATHVWRAPLTIPAAQVLASQTAGLRAVLTAASFPAALFDGTDGAQADGGDIRFSSDQAGTSALSYELLGFDKPGGTVLVAVEIGLLSQVTDTVVYIWWKSQSAALTTTSVALVSPLASGAISWVDGARTDLVADGGDGKIDVITDRVSGGTWSAQGQTSTGAVVAASGLKFNGSGLNNPDADWFQHATPLSTRTALVVLNPYDGETVGGILGHADGTLSLSVRETRLAVDQTSADTARFSYNGLGWSTLTARYTFASAIAQGSAVIALVEWPTAESVGIIGGVHTGSGVAFGLKSTLAESVLFDDTLSDAEKLRLEGWTAHKWALSALLPAGHAYKYTQGVWMVPGAAELASPQQLVLTHGSATFYMEDVGQAHGVWPNGRPWVVSSAPFEITSITPDSAEVAALDHTVNGSLISGATYLANGAQINPYSDLADPKQGFDRLLSTHIDADGKWLATSVPFDAILNVDPATAGPISVTPGAAFSIVKSIRRAGLTTPGQIVPPDTGVVWRHFDEWAALDVLAVAPQPGDLAPAVSSLDKTSPANLSDINMAALGNGLALPVGMPSLQDCIDRGYFRSGLQPYFGHNGNQRRIFVVNGNETYGWIKEFSGNEDGWGRWWNEYLLALLAEGQSAPQAEIIKVIDFGLHLAALVDRGTDSRGGAGNDCGHLTFAHFTYHFLAGKTALHPNLLEVKGNETQQNFWMAAGQLGQATRWPGNHLINHQSPDDPHVGMPSYILGWLDNPSVPAFYMDASMDADYQGVADPASRIGLIAMLMLKAGPNGWDGAQTVARAANDWGPSNRYAAAIAYLDRWASWPRVNNVADSNGYTPPQVHLDCYAALRDLASAPRWTGVPDAWQFMKGNGTILTAIVGGFSWSYPDGFATEPILEWQWQYSLDQVSWIDVDVPGPTGSQTGLTPGVTHFVRVRRRSASGWGPWTVNFRRATDDVPLWRMAIVPTGTPSGTPVCVVQPKIHRQRHPLFEGPRYEQVTGSFPIDQGNKLAIGVGYWTGDLTGGPSYQHTADGVDIPGATLPTYDLSTSDLNAQHGGRVSYGGVSAVVTDVSLPARPAQAPGVIVDTQFGVDAELNYGELFDSARLFSKDNVNNPALVVDAYPGSVIADEDGNVLSQGFLMQIKTGAHPMMRLNLAARQPLIPGHTYDVRLRIAIGADDRVHAGKTRISLGSALDGVDYMPATDYLADPQPREILIERQFTATGTELWLKNYIVTGVGGLSGGQPALSEVYVADVDASPPDPPAQAARPPVAMLVNLGRMMNR